MTTETSTKSAKPDVAIQVSDEIDSQENREVTVKNQEVNLSRKVGLVGIIGITVYILLVSVLLIYMLAAFWPRMAGAAGGESSSDLVRFLWWQFNLDQEIRLFLIVAVAGALGGEVHALRSLTWYVGNRNLVWSWMLYYILVPVVSASLGIVFYLVIRGGFFSPAASISETSPFGFAALAALTGMFSQSAAEKLKEVADTVLKKPPAGKDNLS